MCILLPNRRQYFSIERLVLEVCHDACSSSSFCNIQDVVLCLMKRVSNNLLEVGGEESQQLVEICIIVTYMLTELKAKREIIAECMSIIICILDMSSRLISHVLLAAESKKKDAVSSFKFGLHEVNSAVGKCDIETVVEVLKTACCVCFIQTEQYAKCVTCLDGYEGGDMKFQFIHNYMKAYACYHSNDAEACLLSLLKLESVPLSTKMKARCHLLHGSLLAKQGRHFEALQEFFKPLSIGLQDTQEKKDFYPITLYHIAEEYGVVHCMYKAHSQSGAKTMQDHGKSSSQQTELLQALLHSDHLDTLQHLVQVLKDDDDDDELAVHTNFTFSIQLKILSILHPQPEINLPVALFKLATMLAANGDYSSAGKMFMELLTQPDLQPLPSLVAQLPHVSIIYHNAAVLLLKSNELDQAQHLCRQAISYHSSKICISTDMEYCLLCLEDDLVALMLLAQVHKHKGDEVKESEMLDRCLRLVNNYNRNKGSVKYTALQEEAEGVDICETNIIHVLSALAAKLHLQKAQNYLQRGCAFQNDSFFELKQALLCNSGDQDAISSYKRFLHENHQYSGHDRSVPQSNSSELHIENCNSLALKHLLQSQASEESDVDFFTES